MWFCSLVKHSIVDYKNKFLVQKIQTSFFKWEQLNLCSIIFFFMYKNDSLTLSAINDLDTTIALQYCFTPFKVLFTLFLFGKWHNKLILWWYIIPVAHYDKCVINLREKYKPDMTPVLECIFSHAQVAKKNILVTMLIVSILALLE